MTESYDNGIRHRRQEVQQAVKNACDQLNADGVAPRDYVEQLAWLFFLKAFDEAENQRGGGSGIRDEVYRRRLNGEYRWASWAGRTDRPDEMLRFVNGELWPHLCNFGIVEETGEFDADPVAEQFRRIFSSVRNHSRRGASFARVVQQVDRLHFSDQTDVIVLSELYEDLLKRVAADSRGFAGEFYTQRHIIRAMVEVVRPKVGERIYDPCFGTGGFLAEAGEYVRRTARTLSGADLERLKQESFFGVGAQAADVPAWRHEPDSPRYRGCEPGAGQYARAPRRERLRKAPLPRDPLESTLRRKAGGGAPDQFHDQVGRDRNSVSPAHHGEPGHWRSGRGDHS